MSGPIPKPGGRPNKALLSPPSSPEMESVPHASKPVRWVQSSAERSWQPWDNRPQPDDQVCVKQESGEPADTAGQGTPLASWHRQTLATACK